MVFAKDDPGHVAEHNRAFETQRTSGYLLVKSANDLPGASGGEHLLPQGGVVEFAGDIDLGANAIRIPATNPPLVRGMGNDTITSSATGGVVRCTNPTADLVLREFSIVATGGPCLNLQSNTVNHQLNMFFVGLIGTEAGTISGFQVQALKDCFINCAAGLTFTGTTRKLFISGCPFYGITGSAITFAATYVCTVADITTSFFKFDSPGVCIEAEAGYTVTDGILRGSLNDGTAVPLVGIDPGDVNWQMNNNTGIRDSIIAGAAASSATSTTTITTISTFVGMAGTYTLASVSERFVLSGNELEYTGRYPALVAFTSTVTIDPTQSSETAIRVTKNGTPAAESEILVEQGAGAGSTANSVTITSLQRVVTGDKLGLAVANETNTDNIVTLRSVINAAS